MWIPYHQIRARFDDRCIVVYQAFNDAIADAALEAQRRAGDFAQAEALLPKERPYGEVA